MDPVSETSHIPDYLVVGQMLDNPEKVPFPSSDISLGENQLVTYQPSSPSEYSQPPEYNTTISPISPSESASRFQPAPSPTILQPTPSSSTPVLSNRILIPTRDIALSSGFPYDPRIQHIFSHDEWHLLTRDILAAAKIPFFKDLAAWTTGVATGTLSSPLILVFGPVAGYYAGRTVHRKNVVKIVKERLDREGEMRAVLRRWNGEVLVERGVQVWLELPVDGAELVMPMEKKTAGKGDKKAAKEYEKTAKKIAKRFRIVVMAVEGRRGQESTRELAMPMDNGGFLVEAMGGELREPRELQ